MITHSTSPLPLDITSEVSEASDERRELPPGQNGHQQFQLEHNTASTLLMNWPMQQPSQPLLQHIQDTTLVETGFNAFGNSFQTSRLDYHLLSTHAALEAGFPGIAPFNELAQTAEAQTFNGLAQTTKANTFNGLAQTAEAQAFNELAQIADAQAIQLPSRHGFESAMHSARAHDRLPIHSGLSQSGGTGHTPESMKSFDGFEKLSYPYFPFSVDSYLAPTSGYGSCFHDEGHYYSHEMVTPATAVAPAPIEVSSSSNRTPLVSTVSPPAIMHHTSNGNKDIKKRGGKRHGPLSARQRMQAREVRKLRACLRCRFLKKTCDKAEPCSGCQPSYARFWQVPCTRIDIKDIGYFMKDWNVDMGLALRRSMSVHNNIKGFSQKEELIWISHRFGFALPVTAREVYVPDDDSCFYVSWTEGPKDKFLEFYFRTDPLSSGPEGISIKALSEYLDEHIDAIDGPLAGLNGSFENAPFITDILSTIHRFYIKEKVPVIRKALKFVLAYNFMFCRTVVEQHSDKRPMQGIVDHEGSVFNGKVITPALIDSQMKCLLAAMWRTLQREILEELSTLYSRVYGGDKLKNWPTIFMLTSILLYIWEEMQFDTYKVGDDQAAASRFCNDMETTPVTVLVGLFNTISRKLPAFSKWEKGRHSQVLDNNVSACDAMTEMRGHVIKHKSYLATRHDTQFDREDINCLSNKFLSKLVIRTD